ncbi:hypothetical protein ASswx1_234 [Aeromonas phage Asswx_1]|uniref:Uncharacterized protein n=1 Tax=Aeromonas phage Asswx_1 TaxID=2419739 RepID=A0A411B8K7_9CAUD|nr:hypothetical protein ASswx1_234 [Aeromonas phage Asswx_1]
MNNEKFNEIMENVVGMVEAGFVSKAGQKRALNECAKMMELVRAEFSSFYLDSINIEQRNMNLPEHEAAVDLYYAQPNTATFAKYLVKAEKAMPWMDKALCEELVSMGEQVVAMIATVKNAPINQPEQKVSEKEAVIKKNIMEIMELRGEQFNRCLRLDEMFGRMMVTANVHLVRGHKGTVFVRAFYYVCGHLTPLNVIIAAMEEAAKKETK